MRVAVLGAGGFIGTHLVERLRAMGHYVVGADKKLPSFGISKATVFKVGDLRDFDFCKSVVSDCEEVYQLAADMGGAGFIFTGDNDLPIMTNSAQININVANLAIRYGKVFFSSSACVYPEFNQTNNLLPITREDTAFPAQPDSEYGWEKIFAERLYGAVSKAGLAEVRIARFHNIYGPYGTYRGGREKAPAAMCRKVISCKNDGEIEIWGDGEQTRSFCYIDDCIEGIVQLMGSNMENDPVNIGSSEMVTINHLAHIAIEFSQKSIGLKHIEGPLGVNGRNSDNEKFIKNFGWEPRTPLSLGMRKTYEWIASQMGKDNGNG
jgi:nucleoside-diphosphate-sugar epimerase